MNNISSKYHLENKVKNYIITNRGVNKMDNSGKKTVKILKKVIRMILAIICLSEEKIEQYHSKKKLIRIILIDLLLISIIDIFISPITYILFTFFNKRSIMSFNSIFLLYFMIFGIITFKNLLHKDFNLAKKIRILTFSIFDELSLKAILKEIVFSGIVVLLLSIALIYFIGNYIAEENINDINIYNISSKMILLVAFIITFIMYVYGAENSYVGNRRKLILYGASTIVIMINTVDSLKEIFNTLKSNNIDFKLMTLAFTLIMSIDKFVSAYTSLIKEYNTKEKSIENKRIEMIIEINEEFELFKQRIQIRLKSLKQACLLYKSASTERKKRMYIYLIICLFLIVITDKHMPYWTYIGEHGKSFIYDLGFNGDWIQEKIIRVGSFIIRVLFIIVLLFNCVKGFSDSISNIKKIRKQKIYLSEIKKELFNLLENEAVLLVILISPILFGNTEILKNIIVKYISNLIEGLIFITLILYSFFAIASKIKERINKYNEE